MKTALFFSFFLITGTALSQDAYIFSTFTDSYTEFSDGTDVVDEVWLEPQFVIPLGFDYATPGVVSDELTSSGVGGTFSFFDQFQLPETTLGVLEYIVDGAAISGEPASTIQYKVIGEPGTQICKVQYSDCAFFNEVYSSEASAQNRMSYQIWLYEGSNAVEIRFGPSDVPQPQLVFDGRDGPRVTFVTGIPFENIDNAVYGTILEGDPQNPVLGDPSPPTSEPPGLNAMPESGRVYRFAPNTTSLNESIAAAIEIYPTLAQNTLIVKSGFNGRRRYQIHGLSGKAVKSGMLPKNGSIDISTFTRGIYLISIEGIKVAQKFVKQ